MQSKIGHTIAEEKNCNLYRFTDIKLQLSRQTEKY